ncbi:hypothetical protein DESC_30012 [Desulfosarcina cetonica]|nr:hypothetical protein DESC_30012 [Desulfosarcina cetonica]
MVPVVWPAESIFQNDGTGLSSPEFTTRYGVATFSKSKALTSICLVVGYAHNLDERAYVHNILRTVRIFSHQSLTCGATNRRQTLQQNLGH